ncbi:AIR carboxylase family protein [Candidatus Woesearchaeota archaeon]|nr:AIR carboxylase family protein [Candidatus Woesearchaeota archaeon]
MKVLIVFGSKSDINVFKPIVETLKSKGIDYDLRICSAHRTPDRLDEILKERFDLIISGAGLAAHLPGVIASKTISPVIGVPVSSNMDGLDAFLAIAQMPPGIPVLGCHPDCNPAEYGFLFKDYSAVCLCGETESKRVRSARNILNQFGVEMSDDNALNINFFNLNGGKPMKDAINVPLLEGSTDKDAKTFMVKSHIGPVVGLNRGENAALLAVMLLNRSRHYDEQLVESRAEMAQKVIESEREVLEDVN